jgi:signal transduction histidine kinase
MTELQALAEELLNPTKLLTHLPYALLVISMMMNDMGWLRLIAIAAALIRIVNRSFFEVDHVVAFWEVAFVGVNVIQLLILWYYNKRHRFTEEETRLIEAIPTDVERRTIRRLLRLATLEAAAAGTTLTTAGKSPERLLFLTDGVAQVEKDGRIVAVCGPRDFVGEMSFISGEPASATVIAAKPVRYYAFERTRLRRALDADSGLRQALDASFNRNLAGKLVRTGSPATN